MIDASEHLSQYDQNFQGKTMLYFLQTNFENLKMEGLLLNNFTLGNRLIFEEGLQVPLHEKSAPMV